MKDIWLMVVGDVPASYQWAGAIIGLVLAVGLLVMGRFGDLPSRPIKHGFTEPTFNLSGAAALSGLDRLLGIAVNIVFWLFVGTLGGYLAAVVVYLTWPWCVVVVAAVTIVSWFIRRWWRRRVGLD